MASMPYLDAVQLAAILADGGYGRHIRMTQATNLLLLSGLAVLSYRWIWETKQEPIDDSLYQLILDFIADAEDQLMSNFAVGNIFGSVRVLTDPDVILLIGQTVPQADYPELTGVVPPSWLVGSDIQLPDMRNKGLFGAMGLGDFGLVEGENEVTLSEAEMPIHTHIQNPHSHTYNNPVVTPITAGIEPVPGSFVTPTPLVTSLETATNQDAGGGQPHNNVQESLQVAWYIIAR